MSFFRRSRQRVSRAGRLLTRPRLVRLEDRTTPAGLLDPSFGTGGIVTYDFGGPASSDSANVVAVQPDGKVVVAGRTTNLGSGDFGLARFLPDGSLDTAFGINGRVVALLTAGDEEVRGLAVQPDGKIVVGGIAFVAGTNLLTLVRYNANGSPDLAFGTFGFATTPVGSDAPTLGGVVAVPGGKLLAAAGRGNEFFLARYNADGSPDTTFGTGGVATATVGTGVRAARVVLQPDGKAVVAGDAVVDGQRQAVVTRFLPAGGVDPAFGTGGSAYLDLSPDGTEAQGLALAPDGRVVACGLVRSPTADIGAFAARLLTDGTPDPAFDGDGNLVSFLGVAFAAAAVQPDGAIVLAGGRTSTQSPPPDLPASVARLRANGAFDLEFGTSGIVDTQLSGAADTFNDLAFATGNRLVAAGSAAPPPVADFGLARYFLRGGVVATPNAVTTTEAGGTAQFSVVLTQPPTSDVVVPLSLSVASEGMLSVTALTFTPANWQTPQTVTVTGLDDFVIDGDVTYSVRLGPAASSDPEFADAVGGDVRVTNIDDDIAGAIVEPSGGLVTTEAGGTATFTVRLQSQPRADVVIPLSSSNPNEGRPDVPALTFTPANWQTPQTVTVTGVDDSFDDGDIAYTIITGPVASADPDYDGLNVPDVSALNLDDDTAGVAVDAATPLVTTEAGGTATFTVRLLTIPRAEVVVPLMSGNAAEGTVPASLTFPPDATALTPRIVVVTGVNDLFIDGDIGYTIVLSTLVSTDPQYAGTNPPDLSAVNLDDDFAGYVVTPTAGLVTTEVGATATFTIRLRAIPTADVTIPLASSDPTEGAVPVSVTLTPATALAGATVTVTGVDDGLIDGPIAYTIVTGPAVSADLNFTGLDPADVAVTNLDNDPIGIVSHTLNGGVAQRSMVKGFAFTFSQVVAFGTGAFRVRRADSYEPALTLIPTVANGQTTVTVTFAGAGVIAGSVPDGLYTLTVNAAQVTDAFGQPLDGDGNGQPGGDFTEAFHRLFGDVNGDRTVNAADFAQFRGTFGSAGGDVAYRGFFDYDGDGTINAFDFGQFRNRFGVTLP